MKINLSIRTRFLVPVGLLLGAAILGACGGELEEEVVLGAEASGSGWVLVGVESCRDVGCQGDKWSPRCPERPEARPCSPIGATCWSMAGDDLEEYQCAGSDEVPVDLDE